MSKSILCLDFDGVVHSYTSEWKGADVIPDPPVPGAIAFLREAVKHFEVTIFSSRSNQDGGIRAMGEWLGYHVLDQRLSDDEELAWASAITFSKVKPPALVTLDDRALTFNGVWPSIEMLKAFQPWNKRNTGGYPVPLGGDHMAFEQEWAASGRPATERPDWPLPSFDARDWAAAFCKIANAHGFKDAKGDPVDEGWMISWFANALMRGYDERVSQEAIKPAAEFKTSTT